MMVHNAASYLMHFDAPPSPPSPPSELLNLFDAEKDSGLAENLNSSQQNTLIDASRENGASALRLEFEAALATQRAAAEAQLLEAKTRLRTEEGDLLARQLAQALDLGLQRLRDDVAQIVAPFVANGLCAQMLDELAGAVHRGLADEPSPSVKISGPVDLTQHVADVLRKDNIAVQTIETDAVDAQIDFSSTHIETRLAVWLKSIANDGRNET